METKTALVTGGTSGVGLSIVMELVKHHYTVYFIGTNLDKGKEIEHNLNQTNSSKNEFIPLNLSNLVVVKKFTNSFKKKIKKLDLLVHVAGIISTKQILTKEGLDKTFAIGYLSVFILSNRLINLLEKGKNARIVSVSGEAFQVLKPTLDFKNLNFKNVSGLKIAFATMHAKTVLTQILSEKLKSKNIDVNSFHPGLIKSNLNRNLPLLLKYISNIVFLFMSKKSTNGIYCCLSKKIIGKTGNLFVKKKPIPIDFKQAYRDQLWNASKVIINQYS